MVEPLPSKHVRHPGRVRSLTSIGSSLSPCIGRPATRTLVRILKILRMPIEGVEDHAEHMVESDAVVGSPDYPQDEAWLRELGRRSFGRGYDQSRNSHRSSSPSSSAWRPVTASRFRSGVVMVSAPASSIPVHHSDRLNTRAGRVAVSAVDIPPRPAYFPDAGGSVFAPQTTTPTRWPARVGSRPERRAASAVTPPVSAMR